MRRRLTNQQTLKEVIGDWLANHPLSKGAKQSIVIEAWGELMGTYVKNRTEKARFNNGVLSVKLRSAVLRNELMYSKETIIKNLNKDLGIDMVSDITIN